MFAKNFDDFVVTEPAPQWPTMMEFSLTNACNLQCVMCDGELSSAIRAHREHGPPLEHCYGDAFFEELGQFLPHLKEARFLGGEPFLGVEPLRVMDMLVTLGVKPRVTVTTNATQWTPRVERICEALPIHFVVSLDGITPRTFESIRVGAHFDDVMDNVERYRSIADTHGTGVSFAFSLMTENWHEFFDLLLFAEERGLHVGVNTVVYPSRYSLYQLAADELRTIVDQMERDAEAKLSRLVKLGGVWTAQISALRLRLKDLDEGGTIEAGYLASALPETDGFPDVEMIRDFQAWGGGAAPSRILTDEREQIVEVDDSLAPLFGGELSSLVGNTTMAGFYEALRDRWGRSVYMEPGDSGPEDFVMVFPSGTDTPLLEVRVRVGRSSGQLILLVAHRFPTKA